MNSFLVESCGLVKEYGKKRVLDDVNIHVKRGEIYGLCGPNGAGKSTLLKIILNLVQPDEGNVSAFENFDGLKKNGLKRTGSIIEYPYFYENLSGRKNLWIHSEYMGYRDKQRIDEVLEQVSLSDAAERKISQYSVGMKQRLAIARAILTKPELLILDEPINGLDPNGIKQMRELFLTINQEYGTTIIISSHILSEVELIADSIGILNQGRLIKEASLKEIHEENRDRIFVEVNDLLKTEVILKKIGIQDYRKINERQLQIFDIGVDSSDISEVLVKNGVRLQRINMISQTLEEYFFQVIDEDK